MPSAFLILQYYQPMGLQPYVSYGFSEEGNLQMIFFSPTGSNMSVITFTCTDEAGYGTFDMTGNETYAHGTLSSSYACFQPESPSGPSSIEMLLIGFFSALVLCFIFGILFFIMRRFVCFRVRREVRQIEPDD